MGDRKDHINEAISSHLDSFIRDDEILLSWDDLLKRDASEFVKLKEFLDHRFNLSWIKNSNLHFKNDRTVIIVDNKVKNENLLRKKLFSALFFVFKGNRTKMTYKVDTHSISINYDEGRNNATLRVGNHDYTLDATKETGNRISLRLKGPEILTVWFDAWRYEREEYFALIALMKTIAYAMKDVPYYQNVKQVLLRGLGIIGKDVLRHFATQFAAGRCCGSR